MAFRYTQETWEWIKSSNPSPAFLRWAREEGHEALEPTASEDVPLEGSPLGVNRDARRASVVSVQATAAESSSPPQLISGPQENLTAHQAHRQEERLLTSSSLEHRIRPSSVSVASATHVNAAYYKPGNFNSQSPSTSGSLDRRLQEADANTQRNRGRDRSETIRPERSPRSASTVGVSHRRRQEAGPNPKTYHDGYRSDFIRPPVTSPSSTSTVRVSDRTPGPSVACGTAFTPTVKAILDYQRTLGYGQPIEKEVRETDPKIGDRRPDETVFTYCNICSDDVSKPTWCVHPEYEGVALDLLNDAKLNRGKIQVDGKQLYFHESPIEGDLEKFFAMIHPKNICTLLTENVQEAATNWVFFTDHGTLLGYSEGTTIELARTVATTVGAAWRLNHDLCILGRDDTPRHSPFLKNMSIRPFGCSGSGAALEWMYAELNGMAMIAHDVKQRLLLVGMHPLDTPEGSKEGEASERMKSMHISNETDPMAKKASEPQEGEEVAASASSSSSSSNLSAGTTCSQRKGKTIAIGEGKVDPKRKFARTELLMLKVEGMVEVLEEDLANFRMPNDFI